MIQVNFNSISEYIKKNSILLGVILILIFFNTCDTKTDHTDIIKLRESEIATQKKTVDSLLKSNGGKDKLIIAAEDRIMKSEVIIEKQKNEISKLLEGKKNAVAQLKDYQLTDWKKFYQKRTKTTDTDISIENNTLKFTRKPLEAIGSDLVIADFVEKELVITQSQLLETQKIVDEKDVVIENERLKSLTLLSAVNKQNDMIKNFEENVSDLKSDLKKANKPKIKTIIISAVLGGIGGALLVK